MTGDWKPGDVGVTAGITHPPVRFIISTGGVKYEDGDGSSGVATSSRPLVVIDPEDLEQVGCLVQAMVRADLWCVMPVEVHPTKYRGGQMQAALRSLIADPKPDEPTGRYAAVVDADGGEWVRLGDGPRPWMHNGSPSNSPICAYADITAVKVLSDGVSS